MHAALETYCFHFFSCEGSCGIKNPDSRTSSNSLGKYYMLLAVVFLYGSSGARARRLCRNAVGREREVGQRLWNWFCFLYVSDVLRLPSPSPGSPRPGNGLRETRVGDELMITYQVLLYRHKKRL